MRRRATPVCWSKPNLAPSNETTKNSRIRSLHLAPSPSSAITIVNNLISIQIFQQELPRAISIRSIATQDKQIDEDNRIGSTPTEPDLLHTLLEPNLLNAKATAKVQKSDATEQVPMRISISPATSNEAKSQERRNIFDRKYQTNSTGNPIQLPGNTPHRSLFKQYWERSSKEDVQPLCEKGRLPHHIPLSSQPRTDIDIRNFSPPSTLSVSLRDYHARVEDFPNGEIPSKHLLPTLPAPLRRWSSCATNSHGKGMYPLHSPKPILRKQRRWKSTSDIKDNDDLDGYPTPVGQTHNFELTSSSRGSTLESSLSRHIRQFDDEKVSELFESSEKSKDEMGKRAHFDPRIVITEFVDQTPRIWYSDEELTCFKSETIMLAQQYMLLFPELSAEFNKPSINPITGGMRKRALYSLPILNALPDSFDVTKEHCRLDALTKQEIKKILVVDPNKAILNLFCKSLQQMFPHAKVFPAQTGEDALKLFAADMAKRGHTNDEEIRMFDIIVAEERLSRARPNSTSTGMSTNPREDIRGKGNRQTNSFSKLIAMSSWPNPMNMKIHLDKQSSFSNLYMKNNNKQIGGRSMSGSDLIRRIRQLEKQAHGDEGDMLVATALQLDQKVLVPILKTQFKKNRFQALLIGVCVCVDRDGDSLRKSGADMVWGKPPPVMGMALRNRILGALMTKRGKSDMSEPLPRRQERQNVQKCAVQTSKNVT